MTSSASEACAKCPTCGDDKPAVRAPRVAHAIIPLGWAAILLFGACLAILVPLNLVLIPCWLAVGTSLGALARELLDWKCASCGAPRGSAARAPYVARRSPRPAHERAMEGGLVGEA
jgi:hypothetical protein